MAKEVAAFIKLQIKGGAANPSPPVGPASVSYTHLDVYKRQSENLALIKSRENLITVAGESEGGRRPVEEIDNDIKIIFRNKKTLILKLGSFI